MRRVQAMLLYFPQPHALNSSNNNLDVIPCIRRAPSVIGLAMCIIAYLKPLSQNPNSWPQPSN